MMFTLYATFLKCLGMSETGGWVSTIKLDKLFSIINKKRSYTVPTKCLETELHKLFSSMMLKHIHLYQN